MKKNLWKIWRSRRRNWNSRRRQRNSPARKLPVTKLQRRKVVDAYTMYN